MVSKLRSKHALDELCKTILEERAKDNAKLLVTVCNGTGCRAGGSAAVIEELKHEIVSQGLTDKVNIRTTGCHGFCEAGPMFIVQPGDIFYQRLKVENMADIVRETIIGGNIIDNLLYTNPVDGATYIHQSDIPFYRGQQRIILGSNSRIDPCNIEDYIALGGYSALAKAFEQDSGQIIEEIKESELRGRGGAGFPTGVKWEATRKAYGEPKYVIVNCDEGDPGAFMDRTLMEGNPHLIIEGLIIGAYAIGTNEGIIYVRAEYPLALSNTEVALRQAEAYGLLGNDILGSGFNFHVRIHRGAGAFVSGESSAMVSAMQGEPGEPRLKYVHLAEFGLKGRPTNINNVETWANVPLIIDKGASWFNSIGTERSKGTKIFCLTGCVNNTGLVEVPMGMPLRDLIQDIGGGVPNNKKVKAVQVGGPSGGLIPEQHLHTAIDFDELSKMGAMMGSGGLIVMDEDTCVVDMAKFFVDFCCEESCGKCIAGREGLRIMREYLNEICAGEAGADAIEAIEDIAELMRDASLCALCRTAANPVITSLRYFREEYEDHIGQKRCPAKVCPSLVNYYVDPLKCNSMCDLCLSNCPSKAVQGRKFKPLWIDQEKCIKCGICSDVCSHRYKAVSKFSGEQVPSRFLRKGR